MAGLVPAIHASPLGAKKRGCPGRARAWRVDRAMGASKWRASYHKFRPAEQRRRPRV